ncbi:hypothetical protein CKO28_07375 [Rhodovibrio sodomensis]|uniref:Cytochrome c domain-containing protein n=1 Tax=Rhodovibrio sodomensis TaxID=1088 RepID=A0ABS1DDM1_9PROT|nr:c-type cytochrome [Rhodovibrio sodomensis]MBK1667853.1 hypothetical protein [Rhodovibrio sodomensis]
MSLELNKIAAAVLTAGVVAMGTGFVANLLVNPHAPEEPVYKVALKNGTGGGGSASGGGSGGQEEQAPDLATLLANASASEGEQSVRACAACHSFNKGGPNKIGPNLYDVIGADIASVEDFNYSDALSSKEGDWTYEKMNAWLKNPSGWASGTSMTYPGIKDAQKRADVIAYLRQQSDNPPPLPEPEAQTAEASGSGGQSADGGGDQQAADGSGAGDMQSGGTQSADMPSSGSGDAGSGGQAARQTAGESQTAEADTAKATGGGDSGSGGGSALRQQIASADPSAGQSAAAVCSACHSWNQGGPNKVGPNLYDVIGSDIASVDGFNYSDALASKEGEWTLQKMNAWLANPNKFASGNRMTYPGVKDDKKRHAIIAYMLQQSDQGGSQ